MKKNNVFLLPSAWFHETPAFLPVWEFWSLGEIGDVTKLHSLMVSSRLICHGLICFWVSEENRMLLLTVAVHFYKPENIISIKNFLKLLCLVACSRELLYKLLKKKRGAGQWRDVCNWASAISTSMQPRLSWRTSRLWNQRAWIFFSYVDTEQIAPGILYIYICIFIPNIWLLHIVSPSSC